MKWKMYQLFKAKINILKMYFMIVGVISSFATIVTSIFPDVSNYFIGYGIKSLLLFFGGLLICAIIFELNLLFQVIKFQVTKKIEMGISVGNILKKNSIIVIPVNEYFDVVVDDNIIAKESLHGQFITNFFGGNTEELKNRIKAKLDGKVGLLGNRNEKKYPLGTAIKLKEEGKTFFLIALSKFDENDKAYSSMEEYKKVLESLISYIHINSNAKKVCIPLIGAGQSGIELTEQGILENLIHMFKLRGEVTVSGGIEIVVYTGDACKINLARIRSIVNEQ
ncbi:macro domain-containing protein [Psychrilyobacter atlanticus]|uniref:macro domain-containing protein n=1 Tax=Psychrilyobacter atlanticus TaxID=271091 RepID=UPI0003FD7391|nr:macro domain-containing protein [Psychrilyobacter atlanticus]